eukprot:39836-Pelagomonas_calceolata.AAC.2
MEGCTKCLKHITGLWNEWARKLTAVHPGAKQMVVCVQRSFGPKRVLNCSLETVFLLPIFPNTKTPVIFLFLPLPVDPQLPIATEGVVLGGLSVQLI